MPGPQGNSPTLRTVASGLVSLAGSLVIDDNAGIGTTNPLPQLHIRSAGSVDLLLEADTDDADENYQPSLTFSQDGGRVKAKVGYLDGQSAFTIKNVFNGSLHLGTNDTQQLTILNDGNVGIGTTRPNEKLEVNGNLGVDGDLRVDGAIVAPVGAIRDNGGGWVRTYGNTGWYNQAHGGGWWMTDTTWIRSYGGKSILHSTGILRTDGTFQVGADGSRFIVDENGNVGIGRTDPLSHLHISSAGSVDILLEADTDDSGENHQPSLTFSQDGGIVTAKVGYFDGQNAFTIKNVHNGSLHLGTNDTQQLTIFGDGNVGIGTTSSSSGAKLEVSGTIKATKLVLDGGTELQCIIAGRVNSNGTRAAGSGFTSIRVSTGKYRVTFSSAFASTPIVVATCNDLEDNNTVSATADRRQSNITTFDTSPDKNADPEDASFSFIAIGVG